MLVIIGIALAVGGLLILLVGKLANEGRLKRNHLAGIRTRGTMASDDTWLAAHQAAWPSLFWAGMAGIVVGLSLAILQPGGPDSVALIGIGLFSVVAMVVSGARKAMRAAAKLAPDTA